MTIFNRRLPQVIASVIALLAVGLALRIYFRHARVQETNYWPAKPAAPLKKPSETIVQMLARLGKIPPGGNADDLPRFLSSERAERLKHELAGSTDPLDQIQLLTEYATELLSAGDTDASLRELSALDTLMRTKYPAGLQVFGGKLELSKAIAYLRLGEQQNCLSNHNAQSCILPIEGAGVHKIQYGSRHAIQVLTDMLRQNPNDLSAGWLLNLAYMTLGEYPDKVPAEWRIPPSVFKSDYDIKRFPNVAGDVGLDVYGLSGGCIMEDFTNDGRLDIICSSIGLHDQLHYFYNNGDGTFTDRTKEAGLTGETSGLNIICADYNNDGKPDVFVLRGGWFGKWGNMPSSLLRNNGNGTFTDVTEQANLLTLHPTQTAVWFDYDGDGWLDLFIGNETLPSGGSDPSMAPANPCELYHNNHDGTFTECAASCGVAVTAFVKGVTSADYNNDGRPDLYLSCLFGPNILFRNDGPDPHDSTKWKFTNVASAAGVAAPQQSFSTFFFDYDNDGWPDLFVSGYGVDNVGEVAADYLGQKTTAAHPRLYHNNHDGTFTDVTRKMDLDHVLPSMGIDFGDLDNDGYLDIYLGTGDPELTTLIPNRMFRNNEGKTFQDVTTSGGFGDLQKGHGIAFGDIDNDGDQDIFEVMGGALEGDTAFSVLYENPGHGGHWLKLKLVGVQTNRCAIGARIKVTVRTPSGSRQICRTVNTGTSFGSNPLRQEIGLGNAQAIQSVEVYWPVSRTLQRFTDLSMDKMYQIREGDPHDVIMPLRSFHLRHTPLPHSGQMPGMAGMMGMTNVAS